MRRLPVLLLLFLSLPALSSPCRESKEINHVFPAGNFTSVKVKALAGYLEVIGSDTDTIELNARACTDEVGYLDQMTVDVDDTTDELTLAVVIPYKDKKWYADYAYMDLEVKLPRDLATHLRDSSGEINASNATITRIDDSSGDIHTSSLLGDLIIKDSSGNITLRKLDGNLTIHDSSGRISVSDITGDVTIPRDSSGDIKIDSVSGLVLVERDSSGDIEIENVKESVTIDSDGSGGIRISEVDGSVSIGRDGSGTVRVSYVQGDFHLDSKGSGNIRTKNIHGKTSIPR